MKIQFMSDLHLEFYPLEVTPAPDVDVMVFAGDIGLGVSGLDWIDKIPFDGPKLYVPGNHEFYGGQVQAIQESLLNHRGSVTVLDYTKVVEIGGYKFIGDIYWTDFSYRPLGCKLTNDQVKEMVANSLNDYVHIRYEDRALEPTDTEKHNHKARAAFCDRLLHDSDSRFVVITHHAPTARSSLPRYMNDPVTAAYANSDYDFIDDHKNIDLWIHGHCHNSSDYKSYTSNTRIVANPRGYASRHTTENRNFDPMITVDLP